jgi:hypothetical protein
LVLLHDSELHFFRGGEDGEGLGRGEFVLLGGGLRRNKEGGRREVGDGRREKGEGKEKGSGLVYGGREGELRL